MAYCINTKDGRRKKANCYFCKVEQGERCCDCLSEKAGKSVGHVTEAKEVVNLSANILCLMSKQNERFYTRK